MFAKHFFLKVEYLAVQPCDYGAHKNHPAQLCSASCFLGLVQ